MNPNDRVYLRSPPSLSNRGKYGITSRPMNNDAGRSRGVPGYSYPQFAQQSDPPRTPPRLQTRTVREPSRETNGEMEDDAWGQTDNIWEDAISTTAATKLDPKERYQLIVDGRKLRAPKPPRGAGIGRVVFYGCGVDDTYNWHFEWYLMLWKLVMEGNDYHYLPDLEVGYEKCVFPSTPSYGVMNQDSRFLPRSVRFLDCTFASNELLPTNNVHELCAALRKWNSLEEVVFWGSQFFRKDYRVFESVDGFAEVFSNGGGVSQLALYVDHYAPQRPEPLYRRSYDDDVCKIIEATCRPDSRLTVLTLGMAHTTNAFWEQLTRSLWNEACSLKHLVLQVAFTGTVDPAIQRELAAIVSDRRCKLHSCSVDGVSLPVARSAQLSSALAY